MSSPKKPAPWSSPASGVGGQLGRLGRLVRKELYEILRDRRTIITLVLMPLLLYPLLSIALQQLLVAGQRPQGAPEYVLGFFSDEEGELVIHYLGWERHQGKFRPTRRDPTRKESLPPPVLNIPAIAEIQGFDQHLGQSLVHLGIRVRNLEQIHKIAHPRLPFDEKMRRMTDQNVPLELELIYVEASPRSREVLGWMQRQCASNNIHLLRSRMRRPDRTLPVTPVETWRAAKKTAAAKRGSFLAPLVPLILILMTITGAVYPAIDLTAGERERGTLEILVAAPVPRLGLLFAKYVTVLTVAVLTALVNLVMLTVTVLVMQLGPELFGSAGLSVGVIVEVFALLLLFAAFFSAVMLTLTSFARSFKEAQAYLIPLMLVSLTPGMLAMMPDLKLSFPLAVTPLINIILLARDLFHHKAEAVLAVVVVLSTLLYAFAALAAAARIFGAEGVLYSEQANWADLFRRPAEPQRTASVNGAFFCLALMFPAYFLLNAMIANGQSIPLEMRIGFLICATVLLFGAFPLVSAAFGRVTLSSGFQLHRAPWFAYGAAMLLGLCLWPFVLEIVLALQTVNIATLGPEHELKIRVLLAEWKRLPPALVVLAYAVLPAVFEELFFRGYLFGALRAHTRPATAIIGSALFFGLFHVVFAFDRLVPSTLLGVVLGWVCWRTGSVFPGMVLHACHNTFLVLVAYYKDEVIQQGWFVPDKTDVPALWLIAGGVGAGIGAALLYFAYPAPRRDVLRETNQDQSAEVPV